MKPRYVVSLLATALSLCRGPSQADPYVCEGVALRDAHAQDQAAVIHQGAQVVDIVRYEVDTKTGEDWYCAPGNCYRAHVTVDGAKVEAIHLANCRVGGPQVLQDPKSRIKSDTIELLAAGDVSNALSFREVDMRVSRMGLCASCVDNAVDSYMRDPQSRCGQLVGRALTGDPEAKKTLAKAFPDFCWELSESQPPALGPDARKAAPFAERYAAESKGFSQELEINKLPDGSFDINAVVGNQGCAGSIVARGAADGDNLKAQAKTDNNATCILELRRTKKGVSVDEGDNCSYFHGASCDFTGDYREKR
jgi:hypothetical protein